MVDARYVLRSLSTVALVAGLAACAYQDPFTLPPLDSQGMQHAPSTIVHYGHDPNAVDGDYYSYGYNPYGYQPYYYDSGNAAVRYTPPGYAPYPSGPYCSDANRNGRCNVRSEPPERDQQPEADMFERLRERIDARAGARPTTPAPMPRTLASRPPPPPKVVPPKAGQSPAGPGSYAEQIRRSGQPAKRPSIEIRNAEP